MTSTPPHGPFQAYNRPKDPRAPKRRRWPYITGGAVALFALLAVIGSVTDENNKPASVSTASEHASTQTSTSTATPTTSRSPLTTTTTATDTPLPAPPLAADITDPRTANAALAKLNTLAIKGRAPETGYDRAKFGQTWTDDVNVPGGHNGCDTRNDILRRDLIAITLKPNSHGCTVQTGTLNDPYTDTPIPYDGGQATSSPVQIDHVVALSDAWQTGAQPLDPATLQNLANDPINLQATDGAINQQKGDSDAATWLPPHPTYRCTYVSRQVDVKAAYALWVTQDEHDAIARVLYGCGATPPAPIAAPTVQATSTVLPPPPVPQQAPPPPPPAVHLVPQAPAPAPLPPSPPRTNYQPSPSDGYGSCGDGYYENSAGRCIPVPGSSPDGATARCKDGTYSYSQSRRGTCSNHGGVAEWL